VVLGDSVAVSWVPGLRAALEGSGWRIQLLTYGECPAPLLPTARSAQTRGTEFRACTEHRQWALDQVRRIRPDLVVVSSQPTFASRIVGIDSYDAADNYAAWRRGLTDTLTALQPLPTVVLAAPPKSGNLQTCATRRGTPKQCIAGITPNWLGVSAAERAAARATGARYVDSRDWFCYAGKCPAVIGTTPVMWDGAHITAAWSRALAPELRAALLDQ
jgi:hypothetical protein